MPETLQVLLIGNAGIRHELTEELGHGGYHATLGSATGPAELDLTLKQSWDIAVAHFAPGEFGAIEALQTIRERDIDLPVIVISGKVKDSDVVAVLKAGAADHLTRGNLMRLNAAVERELRAVRLRKERTGLEEQFRQAQKMEAVGRLAGGVAHDFNNLLTVITGYSDLLLTGRDLKDSQRSALEEVRRAAERGGALTHQLLAFSRRQPMQVRTVALNELVMNLQKLLRRLIGEDVSLVIIPAAPFDTVEADPGRVEQVLMNLVVNARDAMPDGGRLTIETANIELTDQFSAKSLGVKPGKYVMLSLTDTGTGMDKETLSHVFEPFFTTKSAGRGTGLGLATAYGIIRQSGGAITLLSESGQGTSARIYLPVSAPEVAQPDAGERQAGRFDGKETILVVEDEARVRKLICDVLGTRGYAVLEATRGEEALRLARQHKGAIDLLLIDVVMPEMSGPEVAREIGGIRPGTRVLFMSGYTDEAIVHHGIPESGAAFLPKPFLPDRLARKVREVLDARSSTGNSTPAE
jgi:two-component system, cell cycle sensor histidine kinase and response regulator CckA